MTPAARKQKILAAIVESFISTGEPVGSKALIGEKGLNVSSATVRNDMADLTAQGFIVQPHTSAGRIPTALGYRYFVDNVMQVTPLAKQARDYIRESLREYADSPESILQGAANLLSRLTDYLAASTTPSAENCRIRRLSFVQTGNHTAMVVLIASNGVIKTKLFRCGFVITPELLEVFDKALNELFVGIPINSVNQPFIQTAAARFGELSLFMPSALIAIKEAAELAGTVSVCHSGFNRLLLAREEGFAINGRVLEFLQSGHDLAKMLERLPQHTAVTIGRENNRIELASSSVISTRYSIGGKPSGTLAVITPLRADYARVIAILEGVAEAAGELIEELVETENDD